MSDTLDLNNKEDLKEVIEKLSKNDEILESRLIELCKPMYSKLAELEQAIADAEYKLEIFARMQEKLMIKEVEGTKEYVQKVTIDQYKDVAKKCNMELNALIDIANHYEKKENQVS